MSNPIPPGQAELLQAANAVYAPGTVPPGLTPLLNSAGEPVTQSISSDGFYAAAFKDSAGNIILAFQGTNSIAQVPADAQIFSGQRPAAYADAVNFASNVRKQYASTSSPLYVTGHSLGGGEAEAAAEALGLGGGSFGAPGLVG